MGVLLAEQGKQNVSALCLHWKSKDVRSDARALPFSTEAGTDLLQLCPVSPCSQQVDCSLKVKKCKEQKKNDIYINFPQIYP